MLFANGLELSYGHVPTFMVRLVYGVTISFKKKNLLLEMEECKLGVRVYDKDIESYHIL